MKCPKCDGLGVRRTRSGLEFGCIACDGTGEIETEGGLAATPSQQVWQPMIQESRQPMIQNKKEAEMPQGKKECICKGADKECQWCKGTGLVGVNNKFKQPSNPKAETRFKKKPVIASDEGDKGDEVLTRQDESCRTFPELELSSEMRAVVIILNGSADEVSRVLMGLLNNDILY